MACAFASYLRSLHPLFHAETQRKNKYFLCALAPLQQKINEIHQRRLYFPYLLSSH